MQSFLFYLVVLILSVIGITEASVCYTTGLFYSYYEYCPFGCCGYGTYQYCCSATWPIIGIVIGVGVMIGVIVTIVCCCRRSRGAPGMVCQPNPGVTTAVVTGSQVQSGYPVQTAVYQYPVQPGYNAYTTAGYIPPQHSYPQYAAQPGMVGSSTVGYTGQPEVKAASAPPMDPPPPYPQ